MQPRIGAEETEIRCEWKYEDGVLEKSPDCARIEELIGSYLEKVAVTDGGWTIVYKDPVDGRFWSLEHPQSEMHGGGPKALFCRTREEVRKRWAL